YPIVFVCNPNDIFRCFCGKNRESNTFSGISKLFLPTSRHASASGKTAAFLILFAARVNAQQGEPGPDGHLKQLSLEQLGNLEVTSVSKEPVELMRTPAAIYVITQEDIRRSGATSLPEALRLAPGV